MTKILKQSNYTFEMLFMALEPIVTAWGGRDEKEQTSIIHNQESCLKNHICCQIRYDNWFSMVKNNYESPKLSGLQKYDQGHLQVKCHRPITIPKEIQRDRREVAKLNMLDNSED